MYFLENITVYVIPSLLVCSIYNKINEKRIFKNNKSTIIYKCILILMTIYISILLAYLISPIYGFTFEINWSKNLNINPFRIFNILFEKPKTLLKYIITFFTLWFFIAPNMQKKLTQVLKQF
ncbi:hypothetical protein TEMA_09170 [Terrisporobacter mayombei]|uniref:Uncharacterized protein n=1 Tax=Terrisporobacter mayombei TaxID=1541 RepID=A0ABY9PZ35_9FIRM|nr:hypothetical protein TEMA_09170 [Terrisporobacter mayombei]